MPVDANKNGFDKEKSDNLDGCEETQRMETETIPGKAMGFKAQNLQVDSSQGKRYGLTDIAPTMEALAP